MQTELEEFYQHTKCGTIDETGLIQLNADVLKLLDFSKEKASEQTVTYDGNGYPNHLKCLYVVPAIYGRSGPAYFNKHGKGRLVPGFDNGCMPFTDGISFSYADGNVIFFNTDLDIVKWTQYRFTDGNIVCSETPHRYYRPGTFEHPEWRGGICGRIDRDFNLVVPLEYTYEEVPEKSVN